MYLELEMPNASAAVSIRSFVCREYVGRYLFFCHWVAPFLVRLHDFQETGEHCIPPITGSVCLVFTDDREIVFRVGLRVASNPIENRP